MPDVLPRLPGRLRVELAVQQEPNCDIHAADQGQQTPPPGQRI